VLLSVLNHTIHRVVPIGVRFARLGINLLARGPVFPATFQHIVMILSRLIPVSDLPARGSMFSSSTTLVLATVYHPGTHLRRGPRPWSPGTSSVGPRPRFVVQARLVTMPALRGRRPAPDLGRPNKFQQSCRGPMVPLPRPSAVFRASAVLVFSGVIDDLR